ncbi:hypothetical protein [Leptolyngbya ohadii]|uniref:hypothetical protein n=1 Tax=Leptolyngbya ohadii TaxID=1962290 RepID=UPI000B59E620|nr:hypothetical protein [Leptolyngbya ohadii]
MKTHWSKILLFVTATSVLTTGLLNLLTAQAQAKNQTQLQAQPPAEVQQPARDDESDEAALPLVCLGMGYAEQEPEQDNAAHLGLGSVQSSKLHSIKPSIFTGQQPKSAILPGQVGWGTLQQLGKGTTASLQLLLTRNTDLAQNSSEQNHLDRNTATDRSQDDDDGLFAPGFNAGRVCDILSLAVLTPALLVPNTGASSSGDTVPSGTNPQDPIDRPTNPTDSIGQPPSSNLSSNPPSEGLLNQSATVLTTSQPPAEVQQPARDDESDEAALPLVCLGMGYAEQEPEQDNAAHLGLGSVQSSKLHSIKPSIFTGQQPKSAILPGFLAIPYSQKLSSPEFR